MKCDARGDISVSVGQENLAACADVWASIGNLEVAQK